MVMEHVIFSAFSAQIGTRDRSSIPKWTLAHSATFVGMVATATGVLAHGMCIYAYMWTPKFIVARRVWRVA